MWNVKTYSRSNSVNVITIRLFSSVMCIFFSMSGSFTNQFQILIIVRINSKRDYRLDATNGLLRTFCKVGIDCPRRRHLEGLAIETYLAPKDYNQIIN